MGTVTVLMPVHNGEAFVRDAIHSILGQTWSDFEFVIVDDGSTDGTAAVLASFRDPRIRVIANASREGIARSLNRGLAAAEGVLIARQDADDVSHPRRLETQLAYLREHPEVVLLGAQVRLMNRHPAPGWWKARTHDGIRFQSTFDNPFIHGSLLFRRDVVGAYDASLVSAEDYDLCSRVAAEHPVANLPQKLIDFRIHRASTAAGFGSDHIARSAAIIDRNIRSVLSPSDVPEEHVRALASLHVSPGVATAFHPAPAFSWLCRRYFQSHRASADVVRVTAAKWAQIGLRR